MATAAAGNRGAGRLLSSPVQTASEWVGRGEHVGLLLAAATSLTKAMPTPVRYRLADIGGEGAYRLLRRRSRLAEENYRVFAGDPDRARRLTRLAFRNYARTVMDFLVLESLPWPAPGSSGERVRARNKQIALAFGGIIRQEPSQWFAFHRLPARVPGGER